MRPPSLFSSPFSPDGPWSWLTGQGCDRRQKKAAGNRPDEWREFKRRKVNARGESVDGAGERANPFSREEIAAEERRPKRKVAVLIGYAGTGYRGMQVNGDDATIERDLFRAFVDAGAISKANADDPRKSSLARCARTDKGVHAAGNIISLKLIVEDADVVANINARLPDQIRVWGILRTNNSFNCYQYCDSRWYEYLMPSYSLLPPHPHTFLGTKLAELAGEHAAAADDDDKDDAAGFWADVDERHVKPILAALDPGVRAAVLERIHVSEPDADEPQAKEEAPADDGAARQPREHGEAGAPTLASVKPKSRELGPVDFALRDIKAAYIAAKRRYRVTPSRLRRLQAALDRYIGTHNFHNYTVQKAHGDASAKRHIKSFAVDPTPVLMGGTEWLSLKVHGQSFMMHQIRKMVGMASLAVRCATPPARIDESYGHHKMAIPKAPGLGLLLERPVFDGYNRRARDSLGREPVDFGRYDDQLRAFKDEHIYSRIFAVEEKENT